MIPDIAHFIWLGAKLPWVSTLAVRSAALHGAFGRVALHHEAALEGTAELEELRTLPGLELRRIDEQALLAGIDRGGVQLLDVYRELTEPAGRANVLRAAILHREGGVYLDLDTVTVRSLAPLRQRVGAFCGTERIVMPGAVRRRRRVVPWALAIARRGLREQLRRIDEGWRWFRAIEWAFPAAANNAVLGAEPGHAFVERLLDGMCRLAPAARRVRFALGTHLLQTVVSAHEREPIGGFQVLPPPVFYPLGPAISEHWFRMRRRLPPLAEVVTPETLVVHWYASVRFVHAVPSDADFVRAHAREQLLSALLLPVVEGAAHSAVDAPVPRGSSLGERAASR